MENIVEIERYTIQEVRRNTFYQTPKFLFAEYNEKLSLCAKAVYFFLKDRAELSKANGWADENSTVYIVYTRKNLAKDLNVSVPTISKAMEQLKELNLVKEKKRGLGKPNLIYVNFVNIDTYIPPEYLKEQKENLGKENIKENIKENDTFEEDTIFEENAEENTINWNEQTAGDGVSSQSERTFNSGDKDPSTQEEKDLCPNQTNLNETDLNKTNFSNSYLSYLSIVLKSELETLLKELATQQREFISIFTKETLTQQKEFIKEFIHESLKQQTSTNKQYTETNDNKHQEENTESNKNKSRKNKRKKAGQQKKDVYTEEYSEYREIISQNIEYEAIKGDNGMIKDLFELMVDTISTKTPTIKISGIDRPAETVKSVLLKLDQGHIKYVIDCLNKCTTKIRCIRAYMLTSLYNSYSTIDTYYTNQVMHDLHDSDCA